MGHSKKKWQKLIIKMYKLVFFRKKVISELNFCYCNIKKLKKINLLYGDVIPNLTLFRNCHYPCDFQTWKIFLNCIYSRELPIDYTDPKYNLLMDFHQFYYIETKNW